MIAGDRFVLVVAASAFVVASDGTLVVALLPEIAHGVTVSVGLAGQVVTGFAAGYAAGAPPIIVLARRVSTTRLATAALFALMLANALTGAAASLSVLLVARIAAGISAGVFAAAAATTVSAAVPPNRQGRALGTVVAGSSAGTAFGVPIGTFAAGLASWRVVFLAVAAFAGLASLAMFRSARVPGTAARSSARRAWRARDAGLTLATTLLWATGSFTFFTYVSSVLQRTARVGQPGLAGFLAVFGVTGLCGAAAAGRLTDRVGPLRVVGAGLAVTGLALAGLGAIAATAPPGTARVLNLVAIAGYGLGTWAINPPQQRRLLSADDRGALLVSLNASALYAGTALGGVTGALVLTGTGSAATLCWTASAIVLAAVIPVVAAARR